MKLNKKVQYGLLFTLYLSRAGRASLDTVSVNLSIPLPFLTQVVRKLRLAGVVRSFRGIHGGYELIDNPSVGDVIRALEPVVMLPTATTDQYMTGGQEYRALAHFVIHFSKAVSNILQKKIRQLGIDMTTIELTHLSKVTDQAMVN